MLNDIKPFRAEKQTPAKTILIVEDDADIGAFLVELIAQETDYTAFVATDSFAALKIVRIMKPSLLILDYQLPRMNGLTLYDQLHANRELEGIPAILITAQARMPRQEVETRRMIGIGKPFAVSEILEAIEELLEG